MLSKNYKMGSSGKLFLILPLVLVSFCFISCSVKSVPKLSQNETREKSVLTDNKVYSNVEEMPTINGKDTVIGYPIKSQSLFMGENSLEKRYVEGYPMGSQVFSVGGSKLEKRIVVGYPIKSKGFSKEGNVK